MIMARSVAFAVAFYLWSIVCGIAILPLLAAPRLLMIRAMRFWAAAVIVLLRLICDVKVEFRGLEHLPRGGASSPRSTSACSTRWGL